MEMRLVEAIGNAGATRTSFGPIRPVHEVIHDELRPSAKQINEGGLPLFGVESVVLVDAHPRQCLAPLREFVVEPRQFLFGLEQIEPCIEPFVASSRLVLHHHCSFSVVPSLLGAMSAPALPPVAV